MFNGVFCVQYIDFIDAILTMCREVFCSGINSVSEQYSRCITCVLIEQMGDNQIGRLDSNIHHTFECAGPPMEGILCQLLARVLAPYWSSIY